MELSPDLVRLASMDLGRLSDAELLQGLRELAARERGTTAEFLRYLSEADRRPQAVTQAGYPSLFDFCVRDLGLAESTAYQRVKAARLLRSKPRLLDLLTRGEINLSNLCLIAPHLDDRPELLEEIRRKPKREVEMLLAALATPGDVPDRIRALPTRKRRQEADIGNEDLFSTPSPATAAQPPGDLRLEEAQPTGDRQRRGGSHLPSCPGAGARLAPEPRVEIRFAAGPDFLRALERLRALLWHKHPAGRLEDVILEAVADFIVKRDPAREPKARSRKEASSNRGSRRIPARLRRIVWRRDGGRCTFTAAARRCGETRGLEIDHIVPRALGGSSDDAENLRLLCRAHNQSESRRILGWRR